MIKLVSKLNDEQANVNKSLLLIITSRGHRSIHLHGSNLQGFYFDVIKHMYAYFKENQLVVKQKEPKTYMIRFVQGSSFV